MLQLLEESYVDIVFVPSNCTDQLQPLDLSVNKSAKDFLKAKFQQWYTDQIFEQQQDDMPLKPVTFPMHIMKPLRAQWLIEFSSYMDANPDIVRNGAQAAGITSTNILTIQLHVHA